MDQGESAMAVPSIDVNSLRAIDVHVHLEPAKENSIDDAAKKYFGDSGAPRDPNGLAEYYRSRKIAFVVFAVDEKLTNKPRVSNEEVIRFAAENRDIAIPFASIDPNRSSGGEKARSIRRHIRIEASSSNPAILPQRPVSVSSISGIC
jgi:predicted TIM-barrel fold metal-dependent hydrolase